MLQDDVLEKLVPEVYSRLLMMDSEFEYEIPVPSRNGLLGIVGSSTQSNFRLVPILVRIDGSRETLPAKTFTHRTEGTIEIAGQIQSNIRVVCIDETKVELWDWLRSDPWCIGG